LTPGNVLSYQQHIGIVRLDARHGFGNKGSAIPAATPSDAIQTPTNEQYEQAFFNTMVASPYNFGANDKAIYPVALEMNTVSYRSVHIMPARTCEEIIVDEIAAALHRDPVDFRLEFLRLPRAKAVLQRVAGAAQWGKAMAPGFAQGVGVRVAAPGAARWSADGGAARGGRARARGAGRGAGAHMAPRSSPAATVDLVARHPRNCNATRVTWGIDVSGTTHVLTPVIF